MTIISKIKSNLKRLKILDILILIVFAVLIIWFITSSLDVPLDSQPSDVKSARQLARSIARAGKCGSFEDYYFEKDLASFTCQKGSGGKIMFDIETFYNQAAKNKAINDLMSTNKSLLFKSGPFFVIVEFGGENNTPATPKDYVDFPGELSR